MSKEDGIAYTWLEKHVHPSGEFRIFSKTGGRIRLYIQFTSPRFLGYTRSWVRMTDRDGKFSVHPQGFWKLPNSHSKSFVEGSLSEALTAHMVRFPGKNYFGNPLNPEYEVFDGSLRQFIEEYNAKQERMRRNTHGNVSLQSLLDSQKI